MKIISYNVLFGFNHHKSTDAGIAWLKQQDADVVALQELTDIDAAQLQEIGSKAGFPYTAILKEDGFPVGLCSTAAIQIRERRTTDLWHGYMHCSTHDIDFILVHLCPFRYAERQAEAAIIGETVAPLIAAQKKVVVLGDFNAFNQDDDEQYAEQPDLLPMLRAKQERRDQGDNLNNGQLDYTVLHAFKGFGLHDPYTLPISGAQQPRHSFPTSITGVAEDKRPGLNRRIDYILISETLAQQAHSIHTSRDPELENISDHYPLILCINNE